MLEYICNYLVKESNQWSGTAGTGSTGGGKAYYNIEEQMKKFGLSETDYRLLVNKIQEQYAMTIEKNSTVTDFAHQSITTATNLYNNPVRLANVLGFLKGQGTNSHGYINDLSGWLGDVTIGNPPSMNVPDYKADLDAVSITSIMKKENLDYISASNKYYDGLQSGSYTRESEFLK